MPKPLGRPGGYNQPNRGFSGGILLRIEPLGASITHGVASSDGNGYRKRLRDAVVYTGNQVDMVGNNPNGTMQNNQNSGWPGLVINEVHDKSNTDTPEYKPNLVLINAGTNDAIQNIDIGNAGNRMNNLINDIYSQSPQATIILSGLLVNADSGTNSRAKQINTQYQSLVSSLQIAGAPIIWADMQGSDGPTLADISSDGTHPVDSGYKKMANIWYGAIAAADVKGYLQSAE
ncbi:carbohydrate esterase family 3 protein [Pestalotiopsis sp. NC0098]|nr:carbohydrate esterase family 3 protein [Pestalotiopsis sp. NC0098]